MERSEQPVEREHNVAEMVKKEITLPDGRYLIFYNFGEPSPVVLETGGVGDIPPEAGGSASGEERKDV